MKVKVNFTKRTLNEMLEDIFKEYFSDDNQLGLWEIVEYVKSKYQDEINTLEE